MTNSPSLTSPRLIDRIIIDPDICHGKPVVRGMRYPVETFQEYMAAGYGFEDALSKFPDLECEDLLACIQFANQSLTSELAARRRMKAEIIQALSSCTLVEIDQKTVSIIA